LPGYGRVTFYQPTGAWSGIGIPLQARTDVWSPRGVDLPLVEFFFASCSPRPFQTDLSIDRTAAAEKRLPFAVTWPWRSSSAAISGSAATARHQRGRHAGRRQNRRV
jgi:hypothetical protein